ncbi:MAG: BamA/TamA family outer membrane protein [Myxococcales bacterium]|nr:BamA/TamA family outer membrane protein [Myxococcales bacterium]
MARVPTSRSLAHRAARLLVAALLALVALLVPARAHAQPAAPEEPAGIDAADVALVARGPGSLAELEGLEIVAVSVEGQGRLWRRPLAQHVLAPGQQLSASTVRAALRELTASGGVASAAAEAVRHPEGVVVRLFVTPRRVVATLTITVEADRVPPAAGAAAAAASEGMELTERSLAAMPRRVQAMCARKGYTGCEVAVETTDTDDPLRVVLALAVRPGERELVSRRIFVLEPSQEAELGGLERSYDVGAGDPADEDDLAEADEALTERLRRAGFLRAQVSHVLVRRDEGGVVHTFLFVYPSPGARYRVSFEGQVRFSSDELDDALGLATASDVSPDELAGRVRSFYRERGFYDVSVEPSESGGAGAPRHEVHLTIREGERAVVAERLFACLPPEREPDGTPSPTAARGLSAEALGAEIDAVLEESLPRPSLVSGADPVVVDAALGPTEAGTAARPLRLTPATTFTPEAYAKALDHLRDYIHSKGYLNASVGPLSMLRARCDPRARGSACVPLPGPLRPPPACRLDAVDLPVPERPLATEHECRPDPQHGVDCSPALVLYVPIQLGPQSELYDVVFAGNEGKGYLAESPEKPADELNAKFSSRALADVAALDLGGPVSNAALEGARQRLLAHYHDEGYPYASVASSVETSPDRTRARVRFDIHEYGPVEIVDYEVRGNTHTSRALILSRLDLCQDPPSCTPHERLFRRDLVRASEEHIATLGVFSSVSIALEDPEIPLAKKRAIITVVEQGSQYTEPRIGFSSGEGVRGAFEYGHRNIAGQAISFTLRLQFSWLPPPLILDADFRSKYEDLSLSEQLSRRDSVSMRFPDIGLGPNFSLSIDAVDVRANQRDFGITKDAAIPTLTFKPLRELTVQLSAPSVERNDVYLFGGASLADVIKNNPGLAKELLPPEGVTVAVAERLGATWDRRDNAFDAKSGTLLTGALEHVNAFPVAGTEGASSDFLRISAKFGGYIRLSDGGVAIAAMVSTGYNLQLRAESETYPDRLFFLGGIDSLRGFPLDAVVPEDLAQRILGGELVQTEGGVRPLTIDDVPVRGGNLYLNPRLELRTPLSDAVSLGWFLDTGNVWTSEKAITKVGDLFTLRYAAGAGVRLATPLGPIVLDYGFNLVRRAWEDLGALHFAVGLF